MKTMNKNNFICIKINSWFHRISSAFFFIKRLINHFLSIIIISTADSPVIWSDQMKFRQHFFYQSISSLSSLFQQLIFFWFNLIKQNFVSTPFYHRFYTDQHFNSWFLRNQTRISLAFIFIIDSYRPTFNFFSAEITPRKKHHMKIFDNVHIEEYFHLFFFMSWILNFISIYSINEMNK